MDSKATLAFLIIVFFTMALFGGILMLLVTEPLSAWFLPVAILAASAIVLAVAWILERVFNIR